MKKETMKKLTADMMGKIKELKDFGYNIQWHYIDNVTICDMQRNGVVYTGKTKKNPKDSNNLKYARYISFMRAWKNMRPVEESKPDLKPCPFCGKVRSVRLAYGDSYGETPEIGDYCTIVCDMHKGGCGASCGYREHTNEAVKAWNKRTLSDEEERSYEFAIQELTRENDRLKGDGL